MEGDAALVSASTSAERPVLKALMMHRAVAVRLALHPAMQELSRWTAPVELTERVSFQSCW